MVRFYLVFWVALLGGGATVAGGARQPTLLRFAGQLSGCGETTAATLTRTADAVSFAPSDGVLVLRGTVAADGAFTARLNTQPPGKPPFLLTATGQVDAESATVSYVTPRCPQATATLKRMHYALF